MNNNEHILEHLLTEEMTREHLAHRRAQYNKGVIRSLRIEAIVIILAGTFVINVFQTALSSLWNKYYLVSIAGTVSSGLLGWFIYYWYEWKKEKRCLK